MALTEDDTKLVAKWVWTMDDPEIVRLRDAALLRMWLNVVLPAGYGDPAAFPVDVLRPAKVDAHVAAVGVQQILEVLANMGGGSGGGATVGQVAELINQTGLRVELVTRTE